MKFRYRLQLALHILLNKHFISMPAPMGLKPSTVTEGKLRRSPDGRVDISIRDPHNKSMIEYSERRDKDGAVVEKTGDERLAHLADIINDLANQIGFVGEMMDHPRVKRELDEITKLLRDRNYHPVQPEEKLLNAIFEKRTLN